MPFGTLTPVGTKNHVLDEGHDRRKSFAAARSDNSAMRPFAKLHWTHVVRSHKQKVTGSQKLEKVSS